MSRIGDRILTVPENVTVNVNNDVVSVKGPKGELSTEIAKGLSVTVQDGNLIVSRKNDAIKKFHGTANANIANMIKGVTEGFTKKLEAFGVGYRFTLKGSTLVVNDGKSHTDEVAIPSDLKVEVPSTTEVIISGIDKCRVGNFAADIRALRAPEPYKGKGIHYKDEQIRRKEGKKASK